MADGWIELFDVETYEAELLLVFDRLEPVLYGCGVFPLVEVVFFRDCAVDAVEDVFADFAYLGLHLDFPGLINLGKKLKLLAPRKAKALCPAAILHLGNVSSLFCLVALW